MDTATYEIKQGRKWKTVRATSMKALNEYCKANGFSDWRMCGMMSRNEIVSSKEVEIVA